MTPPLLLTPKPKLANRGKVLFGYGLGLVMLVAIAFIAWKSTRHFVESADLVAHTRQVLGMEEQVLRHLMEMESTRRGYLLTGDEKRLRGFNDSAAALNDSYTQLRELVADDPAALERMGKLRTLLDDSIGKQRAEIEVRTNEGAEASLRSFAQSDTEQLGREIYAVVTGFEDHELARLREHSESTRFVAAATSLVTVVGAGVAFIALVAAAWTIALDLARRRRAETALAEQARLMADVIDTMPELICLKDTQGRYVLDNRAHRRYLGVSPGETVNGKTVWDLYPRDIAERHAEEDKYVLTTGAPIRDREERARPAAPNIQWLSTTRMPLRDGTGRIVGLVGVSADISQRKADQEKLQLFAGQLERSNAELQNFASVASHDLQEPLRKIQAFGDRLKTKCSAQLSEQGQDYLARMQNAAARMQTLIQDLLQLSRVTSRAQPFQSCDLAQIVGEVVSDLEVRIEQTGGRVECAELPTIDADPLQMRQLFQNLIANALKFHRPEEAPVVRISGEVLLAAENPVPGAKPHDRVARVMVADNGIGFDQKFADQIFVVFQRLHTKQEYEGTGIGLAVCRKITDRHGGSIVAQSGAGRGAIFTIVLPVKQPTQPNS